ncbi:hypothetical protein GmHk_17G049083 [Glycine max]|nr:hypothetical protein GmHk_17G049083 [Glycine max]
MVRYLWDEVILSLFVHPLRMFTMFGWWKHRACIDYITCHMCSSDPCMLKLSKWSVDFNTNSVKYTHAQCWILIRRLTQEYWRPRILIEIATTVSTLIALDESTRSRNFGHFARLLVDIDLSGNLPNEILVERYSYTFLCWHRL